MCNKNVQTNASNNPRKPVLSLILCSRNDQYMGNSLWRLQATLNYAAQMVHELAREEDVEVLVADWGSDIPLREVLELSPVAANMVSFILIPAEIARDLQKDSSFPEVFALNAAARRAGGEYIGRIDQDTLVGKRFLKYFFELYEGRRQLEVPLSSALLFANRRSIPYRFAVRCPPLDHVDKFIRLFGQLLKVWRQNPFGQNVFWTSYVGIWLLHRDLWDACGGYDERLIYYNWMETDMIIRLTQNHQVTDLGKKVAYDFYHLEHYNPRVNLFARAHGMKNPDVDLSYHPKVLKPSGENWGLNQFPLELLPSLLTDGKFNTVALDASPFRWLNFIILLLSTGARAAEDNLFLSLRLAWRFLSIWRHRSMVAWETVRGQPFISWTRLLTQLWSERRGGQIRQLKNHVPQEQKIGTEGGESA